MGKRGPKGKFTHVSCPNKECKKYGVSGGDNIVSNGTVMSRGEPIQRFFCKECRRYFNEYTDTAYEGLRTDIGKIDSSLKCINDGMGVRATSRSMGCSVNSIQRWRRKASSQSEKVSESFEKDMDPESVQFDEMKEVVKKTSG